MLRRFGRPALLVIIFVIATADRAAIAADLKRKKPGENKPSSSIILKSEIPSLDEPKILQGAVEQTGTSSNGSPSSVAPSASEITVPGLDQVKDTRRLVILAQQLTKDRKFAEAELCLQKAIALEPRSGSAFASLARLQVQAGKQNAAIADYWIARELGATTGDDLKSIAALQDRLIAQCREGGMKYHDYNPYTDRGDVRALLNQGVRFYSIGDHRNAWLLFSEAARQAPQNPDAYYNLGALCESLGLLDRAKKFYLLACKIDPTDFQARLALGTAGTGRFGFQTTAATKDRLTGFINVCPLCRLAKGKVMRGE